MGCGSGMTCWRRLRDWQQAGVWQALHEVLLARLNRAEEIKLVARGRRLVVCARCFGGFKTGPSPVDRRKARSKHHLITDGGGVPLGCLLTAANCNDVTQLLPLLERSRPSAANAAGPAAAHKRWSATAATTRRRTGVSYAPGGSGRGSA